MSYLLSALYLLWVVIISVILFPIALIIRIVTTPFDRRLIVLNYFSHFWGSLYFWTNPFWSIKISGRDKFKQDQPYVVISNHLSTIDVLAASRLFVHFKWVSKVENFKIPFIGWTMYLNRYVAIKRGGISSIKSMMKQSKAHLDNGSSIFIFPEGSRSSDGHLKPFKTGAFKIAKEMNVPIMPVVLTGTDKAVPKNSLHFKGHQKITVEVLEPITPEEYQELSLKELTDLAQQRITKAIQ
ncbi:1-acyl-sn-glycerol-3-phosphate acyltransferase [Psychrobium sp. 1_MG-2023]|uniref:lysophospholipid acyltransferase family protein n=1 Tax=Psychrobium sp. 1_MG-2023 TaxID=3062624 RepID=UPI0026997FD3|nr:lysophospholipid acyltransferase family protein [Psychrobium sp. 1_MG-2023]MDP2562060.1 lysophospholipid acyltransferase family protein [Psychrobium sp. 1_MG-2023]